MESVTSRDGTRIAFDRYGAGPPVVFVVGAFQHRRIDQRTAELGEQLAAAGFSAYHYDRRGRGDSGDTAPYAVEREIEDLEAIIDAAGGSAFVIGHSSGAVLALRAAGKLRHKVKKLAIYEPPFIIDDSSPPLPADYVPHLDKLIAAGRKEDALKYFMTAAVNIPAEYMDGVQNSPY